MAQADKVKTIDIGAARKQLEELQSALPAKFAIQRALFPILLDAISKSESLAVYDELESFLRQIESEMLSSIDADYDELARAVRDFLNLEAELPS
jgi:hypothetical protein